MRMDAAQTLFRVQMPAFDPVSTRAWMRLIKAVVFSFLLHLALLVESVKPHRRCAEHGFHHHCAAGACQRGQRTYCQ